MNPETTTGRSKKQASRPGGKSASKAPEKREASIPTFSPAWVALHFRDAAESNLELIDRIRSGVKKEDWKQLIKQIDATEKEFEFILPTSISSMQKKAVYNKETSERIYELARIYGLGFDVFDTKEAFKRWLVTPTRTLGNKKPFDLLDSSLGFDMVEQEIIRIQYNVYS